MLEEKDPLPGPQSHPTVDDGNHFTASTQHHANMGWHVVRTFGCVNEVRVAIRHLTRHKGFQVAHHVRIRIFAKHQ